MYINIHIFIYSESSFCKSEDFWSVTFEVEFALFDLVESSIGFYKNKNSKTLKTLTYSSIVYCLTLEDIPWGCGEEPKSEFKPDHFGLSLLP